MVPVIREFPEKMVKKAIKTRKRRKISDLYGYVVEPTRFRHKPVLVKMQQLNLIDGKPEQIGTRLIKIIE